MEQFNKERSVTVDDLRNEIEQLKDQIKTLKENHEYRL